MPEYCSLGEERKRELLITVNRLDFSRLLTILMTLQSNPAKNFRVVLSAFFVRAQVPQQSQDESLASAWRVREVGANQARPGGRKLPFSLSSS